MKRAFLYGIILIFILSLSGCKLTAASSVNQKTSIDKQEKTTASTSDSTDTPATNIPEENPVTLLHSVGFINAGTGWIVKDVINDGSTQHSSQILTTQDGGLHWEQINMDRKAVKALKFIDRKTGWAIAEDGTVTGNQSTSVKIIHTDDGGASWNVQWEDNKASSADYSLWLQDAESGYAIINETLLSTHDGGKHWLPVSLGINGLVPQHMAFLTADKGWIIGSIEEKNNTSSSSQPEEIKLVVIKTSDGGVNWQKQFERSYTDGAAASMGIDFVNDESGWFFTGNFATMTGDLYYTADSGKKWNKINQIICARPTPAQLFFVTPQDGWVPLDIGAGPIEGGLMFTEDGGKNFKTFNNNGKLVSAHEVYFISAQQGWVIGTDPNRGDYLLHTLDGGRTWTEVSL